MFDPAILALVGVSLAVAVLLPAAAAFGGQVLRHWDLASGSELQLTLERRTYLISTLVAYAFVAELVALLLFVYTAEALSGRFVGAMCATGVLNLNPWGWPTLFLKIALFFAGALWLLLNRLDHQGHDYPLIRIKYALLLAIAPLVPAEAGLQLAFFLDMDPDVITSCCGALFTPEGEGVAAEVAGLAPRTALFGLGLSGALVLLGGGHFLWRRRGAGWFAAAAACAFPAALAAIVSFVALYVYEHPHHHCPFCLLKEGHGYVGYWLYLPLFAATAFALGAGLVERWRGIASLREAVAADGRRYAWLALLLFTAFYGVTAWLVLRSNLTMTGVWW